jgi:FkbM family methyltransferase
MSCVRGSSQGRFFCEQHHFDISAILFWDFFPCFEIIGYLQNQLWVREDSDLLLNWFRRELGWRWNLALRKRYLRKYFQNGEQLIQSYISRTACDEAIGRDGVVVRHPKGRSGLAQMIMEVWFEEVYTGRFYSPSPGDIIIDAGANIGLCSILMARMQPACRVFAFEPFEENFRLLQANLASASATNVSAFQSALSGESGICEMLDGGARSQDHRLAAAAANSATAIRTLSFAEVLKQTGSQSIALFKCDIEGSEYDLFHAARPEDIRRVQKYAIEFHNNVRSGTLELLEERLGASHELDITAGTDPKSGYGMLYARAKKAAA